MKKTLALAAVSTLGVLAATPALAQENPAPVSDKHHSGFYAGAGINLYFVDKDDAASGLPIEFKDQPSPGAFVGRFGYAFNDYVAVELEAGVGGAKSDFEGPGINGDIGVSGPLSAHAVFTMPVGEGGGYLLGKVGYTRVDVERSLNGVDAPGLGISGASFGVGGGLRTEHWDFRGEYGFVSGGDVSTGVLSMVVLRRF